MKIGLLFLVLVKYCQAISLTYLTSYCTSTIGPAHGHVIQYDSKQTTKEYVTVDSTLDCWITLRGIATVNAQRHLSVSWRNPFLLNGHPLTSSTGSNATCSTAYVELYETDPSGSPSGSAVYQHCGLTPPTPEYTTTSDTLVLHFYIEETPNATVHGVNKSALLSFTMDMTSYITYCSSDGTANDADQYECTSGRCVALTLLCDQYNSLNCDDGSDQQAGDPSNCAEPVPAGALAAIILGALIAGSILFYWCCWRPGWLPWRLARLRNSPCCRKYRCCRNCACVSSRESCAGKCCYFCASTSCGQPHDTSADSGMKWEEYSFDDGMHTREAR
ncbi:hypothetical protein CAPTEDRAFT_223540 [Capitella teleta]|uniref:CUB domain-containing protein n=1 Tax=Capitella teleta TaxID=283909 RepID=R7TEC3_CAPTE|nr:hypothetical protein CAPTEDRAFT_223540 [Capitella teleta]|eukprot:ELT92118.1 hypothetical protein CAPTEDRAFT_223540 [Capitella teleta]